MKALADRTPYLLGLMAIGIAVVAAVACQIAGDPYYDKAADISEEAAAEAEVLSEGMLADVEDCERSIFSVAACDRAVSKLDQFRQVVDTAHVKLLVLNPPAEAIAWHQDILALYGDASACLSAAVRAYNNGNEDVFMSQFAKLDSIMEREDELASRFREIQK
jgi:hypothetical protein